MNNNKAKIKKILPNIILALVFIVGLCIFLYPYASDFINSVTQQREISQYESTVSELSTETFDKIIQETLEFNNSLIGKNLATNRDNLDKEKYEKTLSLNSTGIMGYLKISKINVKLPIYHGTDMSTLQNGIGHLEGTSFPIDSETEHSVLVGHTGLPAAKLLTDLVELKVGDNFDVIILNKIYTYEIDQILVVEPNDTDSLEIEEGKKYCTLVTCTPYGINSHRLLVRGHLRDNSVTADIAADAFVVNSNFLVIAISIPLIIILFIIMITIRRKKGNRDEKENSYK